MIIHPQLEAVVSLGKVNIGVKDAADYMVET